MKDSDSTRASAITLILAFIVSGLLLVSDRGSDRLMAQSKVGAETGFAPVLTVLSKPLRAVETVSEIDGPFVRSALINAGSKVGIKKGHPVMTVDGLYGHVLSVGPNSARVLRLGDLNSRISVMSARSDARAILSGNNSSTPLLAFVEDRAEI